MQKKKNLFCKNALIFCLFLLFFLQKYFCFVKIILNFFMYPYSRALSAIIAGFELLLPSKNYGL